MTHPYDTVAEASYILWSREALTTETIRWTYEDEEFIMARIGSRSWVVRHASAALDGTRSFMDALPSLGWVKTREMSLRVTAQDIAQALDLEQRAADNGILAQLDSLSESE